jgi:Ni,Fe-hydrogenase maturation factor
MVIYVFGNADVAQDNVALKVAAKLAGKIPGVEFKEILPNEDLPARRSLVIMDAVVGLKKPTVLTNTKQLTLSPRNSVHDFDLGFQLKYLQKIGKLDKVTIIGLPAGEEADYDFIHSTLRKLVAQDMHGS